RMAHEQAMDEVARAEQRYQQVVAEARRHWLDHADELTVDLPVLPSPVMHMPLEGDQPGVVGQATRCDGDNQIGCPDSPELGRTSPFTIGIWVKPAIQQPRMLVLHQSVAAEDSAFRGLQLTIDDGHPEFSMIHFWPGNAVRIESLDTIAVDQWTQLVVTHDGSGRADGLRLFINGRQAEVRVERDKLTRDIRHRSEWGDSNSGGVKLALGARFRDVGFRDGLVDELFVFDRPLSSLEVLRSFRDVVGMDEPLDWDSSLTIEHQLIVEDAGIRAAGEELLAARRHENEVVTGIRQIMVMEHDPQAPATHVLARGDYTAKGDVVTANVPQSLSDVPLQGDGRLALAQWMTDSRHPLTSRVMANRMWHLFFGRGIVVSLEDFGSQGTPPTHPELLDFLARYLVDHQWNLHELCRVIVLSNTYRQSSVANNADDYVSDPGNRWLARGPKHRLSAEQFRDSVLAASGLLVRQVGGPSVMPYQPAGLWEEAGTGKSYRQSSGDGLYRRSMYTFWKRTSPPPSMLTFDATSRETCTARRELTTTPLQALVILNDPQYVEAARVLSEQLVLRHGTELDDRWTELFRRLTGRPPTDRERDVVRGLYDEQLAYFEAAPERAREFLSVGERPIQAELNAIDVAATGVVVQTLFAYDETIMLR
ncbi:MAG: DUF1553 domain-containing protein, partial [Planctomycetales bacterium]|nr:DUF1553 domain-containing protein [Planctomycetales bacterium]